MITRYQRRGLAVAAAMTAIGLTACSGGSAPHVANLGDSGSKAASSTTTLPKGNPTQLLDEWATCMQANGDPNQTDPTIDANGVIHIDMPPSANASGGLGLKTSGGPGSGPCGPYLTAASTALRGGHPLQKPDPAKLIKYSECMRAHGIADFPDPSNGGMTMSIKPGSDLNPRSPAFQTASKLCAKNTGVPGFGGGTPPRGAIAISGGNGPGGSAGQIGSGNIGIATGGAGPSTNSSSGG